MKKVILVVSIVLLIVVAGILMINVKKENTDVTKEKTKVGFVLIGECDDNSYNQSHYESMEKTAKALNLNVTYKENVPTDERSMDVMNQLIEDGCEIIICGSYDYGQWVLKVAEDNPDIYFFHATGTKQSKNVATYFGRIYQMRYLSGIVAELQTETNHIGYVAAYPIPEVIRGINAFTIGVREVNPEAVVHVKWCNTWNDDNIVENATKDLLNAYDIDVISMHSDSLKVLEVAEKKGVWSIGYNVDNSAKYPNTFLTAPIWRWEKYYEPNILKCLQGKFEGENYWEGSGDGIVDLAPLSKNVKSGIKEIVESENKKLKSGLYDVFYGPIYDNEGELRVLEGENISDNVLLDEFDWYVEGVEIYD